MVSEVGSTTISRLDPPQKVSFRAEEWPEWCQEFRRFRSASKRTEKSSETQRDSSVYIMGFESEIFRNLESRTVTVGEGDDAGKVQEMDTTFDTLIRKFVKYFVVRRNIFHERTKFHERRQKEGEIVEEFYRSH